MGAISIIDFKQDRENVSGSYYSKWLEPRVLMWAIKFPLFAKPLPQSHLNFFSPVWTVWCRLTVDFWENDLPQILQLNGFSPYLSCLHIHIRFDSILNVSWDAITFDWDNLEAGKLNWHLQYVFSCEFWAFPFQRRLFRTLHTGMVVRLINDWVVLGASIILLII